MALTDIEVNLTDEAREIRDTARKFAEEVMRPAGIELDMLADPADVTAPNSVLWDVFEKYRALGFDVLETVDSELDPVEAARLRCLINEELGWGDSGLAISLGVAGMHRIFSQMSGRQELIERYCSPDSKDIGCWAITEPDHGSDTLAFDQPHFADGSLRANCIATKEGDEYVIRGQKAAWVSNGTIATVAALFCTIDPSHGLDKLGQRALNQGEIFFDDVRIPEAFMVVGSDGYGFVVESVLTLANAAMGTFFVGVARAALEHAIAYAKERVQGGVPIFQHQSVKARLFKSFMQVEAARSLARRVSIYNTTQPPLVQYSIASKVFSTNTAFEAASDALQIFGGNGLSREYPRGRREAVKRECPRSRDRSPGRESELAIL
jgi:alkylation response protein AidB-like acyl-CoA dehydrogenase